MYAKLYVVTETQNNIPMVRIYPTRDEQTEAIQKAVISYENLGYELLKMKPAKDDDAFGYAWMGKDNQEVYITWQKSFSSIQEVCEK